MVLRIIMLRTPELCNNIGRLVYAKQSVSEYM